MLEIISAILIGILLGLIAGMVPGLHPNFIGVLLFANFEGYWIMPAAITMLVSAQFFEFIRSTFLFVPEEGNVLAMHPIFKFVQEGKSLVAIKLCITGLISAIFIGIIFSPILIKIVPIAFQFLKPYIPFALLGVSVFLIAKDKNKLAALIIFVSSGIVGYFGLNNLNQPLLILLTGFFGFSILLKIKTKIPKQIKSYKYKIKKDSILRGSFAAILSSFLLTFIPAVGPSQASLFSRGLLKKKDDFLISIGAISGFDIIFSSILLFSIGKARIGVLEIIGQNFSFDLNAFVLMLLIAAAVAIVSYLLTLKIGLKFSKISSKINYRYVAFFVSIFIIGATVYFDRILGILFLGTAIGIGYLTNKLETNLSHCMGALVIPVLIFYFI